MIPGPQMTHHCLRRAEKIVPVGEQARRHGYLLAEKKEGEKGIVGDFLQYRAGAGCVCDGCKWGGGSGEGRGKGGKEGE